MPDTSLRNVYAYSLVVFLSILFTSLTITFASAKSATAPQDTMDLLPAVDDDTFMGEIAISLDDAPMPGTVLHKGMEKTQKILQALQETNCPAVGIFATAAHAQGEINMKRLRMYGEAGHVIANHSYSHYKLDKVTSEKFIADIKKAHEVLSVLPNFKPFFRFPYLVEGKNKAQRQVVIHALDAMGYQEGYTTVNNHDYYLNKLLLDAVKAGKTVDYDKLRKLYLSILWDCIETNQKLAYKVCNRKVKHVLLLHENDLAALFIRDLIAHIRKQGWKIISIEEAYQDPIARIPVTNTYSLTGRIGTIAVEQGLGKGLVPFPETTYLSYISKAISEQGIFKTHNRTHQNSE